MSLTKEFKCPGAKQIQSCQHSRIGGFFSRQRMTTGQIEIDETVLMEKIRTVMRDRQRYAGHREGGPKYVKERSIVCEFLHAQEARGECCSIRIVEANPVRNATPDCFGTNIQGGVVAYEVTELVDEETITRNLPKIPGQPVLYTIKEWQPDELIEAVQAILKRKDSRDFKGAVFEKIVLLIHTSEPALEDGNFTNLLTDHAFSSRAPLVPHPRAR